MPGSAVAEQPLTQSVGENRIVVLALSGIGDALMFSPALELLHRRHPGTQIDLVTMFRAVDELYRRNSLVRNVFFHDFLHARPASSIRFLLGLRRRRYDVSINVYPSNRWHYNLVSLLIGARKRLGHDYNHANFRSLNFLNSVRVHEDDRRHNVEENILLVGRLGEETGGAATNGSEPPGMTVVLTADDRDSAAAWIAAQKIDPRSLLIGVHAGSSPVKNHDRRRWAPEKFAQLASRLSVENNATVLLFGGPDEAALNRQISGLAGGRALCVEVPALMTSAAIMKRCSVFVSNDSGLMHLAAGLRIPTVAIFAYTNPRYVSPWRTPSIVVRRDLECSPCFIYSPRPARCLLTSNQFRCITEITVEEVYASVMKLIRDHTSVLR